MARFDILKRFDIEKALSICVVANGYSQKVPFHLMADNSVNVVLLGSGGVGKTSITLQFVRGEFSDTYVPTIEDDFSKTVKFGDTNYELGIIDTAGQDDFKDMRNKYLSTVSLFVIVYAVDDMNSLSQVKELIEDIRTHRGGKPFHVVVAANKCDLDPSSQVAKATIGESKIHEYAPDVSVFETSAKLNKNIDVLFNKLLELHVNQGKSGSSKAGGDKKDGGCCNIQ